MAPEAIFHNSDGCAGILLPVLASAFSILHRWRLLRNGTYDFGSIVVRLPAAWQRFQVVGCLDLAGEVTSESDWLRGSVRAEKLLSQLAVRMEIVFPRHAASMVNVLSKMPRMLCSP